jgi:hypothetical protein
MRFARLAHIVLGTAVVHASAPAGPWDVFNYAPTSRTVYPATIHSSHGSGSNLQRLVGGKGSAVLGANGSWVALDFGVEVRVQYMCRLGLADLYA